MTKENLAHPPHVRLLPLNPTRSTRQPAPQALPSEKQAYYYQQLQESFRRELRHSKLERLTRPRACPSYETLVRNPSIEIQTRLRLAKVSHAFNFTFQKHARKWRQVKLQSGVALWRKKVQELLAYEQYLTTLEKYARVIQTRYRHHLQYQSHQQHLYHLDEIARLRQQTLQQELAHKRQQEIASTKIQTVFRRYQTQQLIVLELQKKLETLFCSLTRNYLYGNSLDIQVHTLAKFSTTSHLISLVHDGHEVFRLLQQKKGKVFCRQILARLVDLQRQVEREIAHFQDQVTSKREITRQRQWEKKWQANLQQERINYQRQSKRERQTLSLKNELQKQVETQLEIEQMKANIRERLFAKENEAANQQQELDFMRKEEHLMREMEQEIQQLLLQQQAAELLEFELTTTRNYVNSQGNRSYVDELNEMRAQDRQTTLHNYIERLLAFRSADYYYLNQTHEHSTTKLNSHFSICFVRHPKLQSDNSRLGAIELYARVCTCDKVCCVKLDNIHPIIHQSFDHSGFSLTGENTSTYWILRNPENAQELAFVYAEIQSKKNAIQFTSIHCGHRRVDTFVIELATLATLACSCEYHHLLHPRTLLNWCQTALIYWHPTVKSNLSFYPSVFRRPEQHQTHFPQSLVVQDLLDQLHQLFEI